MGRLKVINIKFILMAVTVLFLCAGSTLPSYAEEQFIPESFGLYSKGVEYFRAGKLYEAKETLERAIRLDPRNEEAQIYLDLVNAELRMRARGVLDTYQRETELTRERNFYEYEYGYEDRDIEHRYIKPEISKKMPQLPKDKIKAISDALNEKISPGEIKGEYKMAFGVSTDDLIWKNANGDYNERNFRMIAQDFPKINTFDARVYDRFKVIVDTNKDENGLNFHSDITVDPWSFVGTTEKFTTTGSGGDSVELELKYWSGSRSVINESFLTLDNGDSFSTPESKVTDGKLPSFTVTSTESNIFTIPEKEIDFTFQPIRELWFNLETDNYKLKVFPFALEDQALSSDDPLGLSNHHIYWEPSPWLDEWKPGHVNTGVTPDDFWRGEWSDDLSFFTRDSELKRLTALRGVSFQGDFGNTDLFMTVATPKGLWQDYESVNALPGALRTKTHLTDKLMLGFIDTFRIGYVDGKTDSYNYVSGVDVSYEMNPTTNIVGEVAISKSEDDRTNATYNTEKNGTAAYVGLKRETGMGSMEVSYAHMDGGFDSGLANYRETRNDQFWGRHIHFKKPVDYTMWGVPLRYEDIEPFRIGDGVDVGRKAFNFRLDTEDAFDGRMDNLIYGRYIRDANHKYVEGVIREENRLRINPEWTSKLLLIYHDLPDTTAGLDPTLFDSDTGEAFSNAAIEDGKDPSVSTVSFGVEYSPRDWISMFGIYENTNDSRFSTGNHPNGLLNNTFFTTETAGGQVFRKEVSQLYSQGFFDLPPYERFNIYRAGVSLKPSKRLGIDFDYTKNDFKFAAGIDDNMNHFGTTVKYIFNPRLTGFLKYTFSKSYNLFRINTGGDLKYEDHHNVFMEFDYNVTENGLLVVQYGEGSVVSPVWGATANPFGDFYPTLDTRHILRVYYNGKF